MLKQKYFLTSIFILLAKTADKIVVAENSMVTFVAQHSMSATYRFICLQYFNELLQGLSRLQPVQLLNFEIFSKNLRSVTSKR